MPPVRQARCATVAAVVAIALSLSCGVAAFSYASYSELLSSSLLFYEVQRVAVLLLHQLVARRWLFVMTATSCVLPTRW